MHSVARLVLHKELLSSLLMLVGEPIARPHRSSRQEHHVLRVPILLITHAASARSELVSRNLRPGSGGRHHLIPTLMASGKLLRGWSHFGFPLCATAASRGDEEVLSPSSPHWGW